jgi:hypothetical protein
MATAKYKKYVEQMFEENRIQFMEFMVLNTAYGENKREFQERFHEEGLKVQAIVRDWEDRLCGVMESGDNGVYSAKLGEKFQLEVCKYFPYYNEIGMKISFVR